MSKSWFPLVIVDLRKDRYNAKLRKYYVVYGEEDDDISENEETHLHEESGEVTWLNIAQHNQHRCLPPKLQGLHASIAIRPEATERVDFTMIGQHGDSESEEDDETEQKAEQINTAEKDWLGWAGLNT